MSLWPSNYFRGSFFPLIFSISILKYGLKNRMWRVRIALTSAEYRTNIANLHFHLYILFCHNIALWVHSDLFICYNHNMFSRNPAFQETAPSFCRIVCFYIYRLTFDWFKTPLSEYILLKQWSSLLHRCTLYFLLLTALPFLLSSIKCCLCWFYIYSQSVDENIK